MRYISTRGGIEPISFSEAVMMGLAEDGGLILPRTIPRIGGDTLKEWQELDYTALAEEILSRFIDDIPRSTLNDLITRSYGTFDSSEVAPLVKCGDMYILELFHGPTLAFKDIALQFLGNLFDYLLEKEDKVLNILGATSGDTGSAAIYGVRGKKRIHIFILHPHGRISAVQEKQMTAVLDDNVFNIAINGSFDDGQAIVKQLFAIPSFKKQYHLGAVNSINWARVLAQVAYYVYAAVSLMKKEKETAVDFAVPTGNFGDIFAGFIARKMLPAGTIRNLVLATNDNDILCRMVQAGDYSLGEVEATTSPSMDIQAASNFERYLYYLMDCDCSKTAKLMTEFSENKAIDLSASLDRIKRDFSSASVNREEVKDCIAIFYKENGYLLDPHTAVGVSAGEKYRSAGVPMICLATAHPAKFPQICREAAGVMPPNPPQLAGIMESECRCRVMAAEKSEVKKYLTENALLDKKS